MTKEELEKENVELKSECRRCVYTDCPCILSDYGKDRNGICDHFKDVFDENAELKEQIEIKDIQIKELQEQKIYWKESSFDWRHNYFKLGKVKKLIEKDKQLTKAKEIIREFVEWANWQGSNCPSFQSIQDKAEQFIKEN